LNGGTRGQLVKHGGLVFEAAVGAQNPEVSKSVKGHGTPSWRTMEKMLAYCGTVVVRGGGGGTTEAGGSGAQALAVPCDECGAGRVLRWHLSLPGG
jgi:hypothetical protein